MGAVTLRVWTGPNWERRHLRASQPHLPSISCELSDLSFMSEVKLTIMVETFQGMQIPSLGHFFLYNGVFPYPTQPRCTGCGSNKNEAATEVREEEGEL